MSSDKNVQKKEPVKIREKKLANGNVHLFLDIYYNGKRTREFLKHVPYFQRKILPTRNKTDRHTIWLFRFVQRDSWSFLELNMTYQSPMQKKPHSYHSIEACVKKDTKLQIQMVIGATGIAV